MSREQHSCIVLELQNQRGAFPVPQHTALCTGTGQQLLECGGRGALLALEASLAEKRRHFWQRQHREDAGEVPVHSMGLLLTPSHSHHSTKQRSLSQGCNPFCEAQSRGTAPRTLSEGQVNSHPPKDTAGGTGVLTHLSPQLLLPPPSPWNP